jgi:hypothetical protein
VLADGFFPARNDQIPYLKLPSALPLRGERLVGFGSTHPPNQPLKIVFQETLTDEVRISGMKNWRLEPGTAKGSGSRDRLRAGLSRNSIGTCEMRSISPLM